MIDELVGKLVGYVIHHFEIVLQDMFMAILCEQTKHWAKINLDPIICFIDQGNIAINEVNHSLRS